MTNLNATQTRLARYFVRILETEAGQASYAGEATETQKAIGDSGSIRGRRVSGKGRDIDTPADFMAHLASLTGVQGALCTDESKNGLGALADAIRGEDTNDDAPVAPQVATQDLSQPETWYADAPATVAPRGPGESWAAYGARCKASRGASRAGEVAPVAPQVAPVAPQVAKERAWVSPCCWRKRS